MPLLDWLHKNQAVTAASGVPYRLLNVESTHGDPRKSENTVVARGVDQFLSCCDNRGMAAPACPSVTLARTYNQTREETPWLTS